MVKNLIILLLMLVLLNGCEDNSVGNAESLDPSIQEQPDLTESYFEIYRDALDEFYAVICGKEGSTLNGTLGVSEAIIGQDSDEALNSVGYAIMDISGDGVPELVIGSVSDSTETVNGTMIYAVYTVADGKMEFVFEGRIKSSYRPMQNGDFFYQGSSAAMYYMFGTYELTENGRKLTCRDYYFTYEKNAEKTEIGFFHNETGEWNTLVSDEMFISSDEFWDIQTELINNVCQWELEPFTAYAVE